MTPVTHQIYTIASPKDNAKPELSSHRHRLQDNHFLTVAYSGFCTPGTR